MALTEYQRGICQLIATNRRVRGESYVAGGVALNTLLNTPRLSSDIDLFHDTDGALTASCIASDQGIALSHDYGTDTGCTFHLKCDYG